MMPSPSRHQGAACSKTAERSRNEQRRGKQGRQEEQTGEMGYRHDATRRRTSLPSELRLNVPADGAHIQTLPYNACIRSSTAENAFFESGRRKVEHRCPLLEEGDQRGERAGYVQLPSAGLNFRLRIQPCIHALCTPTTCQLHTYTEMKNEGQSAGQ